MSTTSEIAGAFARLTSVYPATKAETQASMKSLLSVWQEVLADIPADVLGAAVMQWLSDAHEWRPTPGQIRQIAIGLMHPARPAPDEAATMAEGWRIGSCEVPDDDLVRRVASGYEWYHWKDEPGRTRSDFLRCYREAIAVDAEERKLCPAAIAYRGKEKQIRHEDGQPDTPASLGEILTRIGRPMP